MQTGTIVKRGRWWYLRFYETVLIDGRPISRQKAVKLTNSPEYRTANEVRQAHLADAVLTPINANAATPETVIPLAQFIEFVYLPFVEEKKKPSTYKGYCDCFKLLKPHMDDVELRKVRPFDITQMLEKVAESKPRAHSTLIHCKNFLSGAFTYAIRRNIIPAMPGADLMLANPAHFAEAPDGIPTGDGPAYTLAELQKMLSVLSEPAKTVCLVAGLTGLRIGEIEALKWTDIQDDELRISRNIWKGHEGTAKTQSSKAGVPLLPVVKKALNAHRKRSSAGEFVFCGAMSGRPLIMENLKTRFMLPAFKKAGITWKGWHGFRRGLATNLHGLGVDDLTISRILRHGSVSVTQNSYIKPVGHVAQSAMRKLDRAFRQAK